MAKVPSGLEGAMTTTSDQTNIRKPLAAERRTRRAALKRIAAVVVSIGIPGTAQEAWGYSSMYSSHYYSHYSSYSGGRHPYSSYYSSFYSSFGMR